MNPSLRILHLEDDRQDAEIIQGVLESDGIVCQVTRVETQDGFVAALEVAGFDLILADFSLPSFDGLSALKIAAEKSPDVPFIFVSGTLGEEVAIDALKIGATDYVLKQRLSRIASSVRRALREASDRAERKHAEEELRRLESRLRQAEKMEAVGRLAGGIAHDFNNILAGILAYGDMLYEEAPADSPRKRHAQNVLAAATRGRALVEQILAYSRSQGAKRAPTDICRSVAETLELVRGSLPANIRLDASAPELSLAVIGDATQLHQVVMNLCSNAIQAMSGGGTLRVSLEPADILEERALSHGTLKPGRYVRLTVEDSGYGMDEATLPRIFEPFFTTKEIGRGTGLGLSLVYAIVTDSGGGIDVKSTHGQGSTFAIYLPLAEIALPAAAGEEGPLPRGNGERVLLVDDEAPLLAVTAEVLTRLGYEPMSFSDSHAALSAFEAAPGRFDVVVTDDLMPGISGTGLASVMRRHRPDLPIVLVSGYSGPILTQHALAAGGDDACPRFAPRDVMTERSAYALETLREGGEFTLFRGRQHGNPFPVLAVALTAEQPSPQSLRRLEHEYSLAADLDPAWAARPLALTRHEGRTQLVLEDPGGEPLDRILDRGTRFLRVAIGLATALGQVHGHGLIHKDIKPSNVLVDDVGKVWLTGFGIASQLPHECQAPAPPEVIAGTLAYMAPEQTGRMNRSIDARSDLYSLGVTLYQMLTGTLPFAAADPLEWVHCHIARQPTPPAERAAVPGPLSSITMKLLAKNAEERYQTASGLESDLRQCLAQWESHGRIDAFPLGAHDASDQLRIPEKLYGREREIDTLLAAFDRVVADGTPELVLVSGYSGVGKSSVVNELHKELVLPRGIFASGKFDQYKRDIPYATLAQAFQTLVRQVLAKSQAEVTQWRHALTEAVGPNCRSSSSAVTAARA